MKPNIANARLRYDKFPGYLVCICGRRRRRRRLLRHLVNLYIRLKQTLLYLTILPHNYSLSVPDT